MNAEASAHPPIVWKAFGALTVAALLGALAILPLSVGGALSAAVLATLWLPLAIQTLQSVILAAGAAAVGLWLGPKVGLGAPEIDSLVSAQPGSVARVRALILPAVLVGVLTAGMILVLEATFFAPRLFGARGVAGALGSWPWQGLLASLYGGINEEIMLRLGLMTLLVGVGNKVVRRPAPPPATFWLAILVAALAFGLGHLPATARLLPLTSLVVARALVLNGLGGVAFGWLYWRKGLLAAMLAHFAADVVIHFLTPMFL